MKDEELE